MLRKSFIVVALVALLLNVGAGQKPAEATVTMKNLAFLPDTIRVKVGDTVTWVNADDRDHTVSGSGLKSGNIKPGRTWSTTFSKPGNYPYGCQYHPRMRGTVVVTE
jgi:plastocyanin